MRMEIVFSLVVCMAVSAGAIRIIDEVADSPPQNEQDAQYRGWIWPWPWYRRPYYPIPPYNPPVLPPPSPVEQSPPPPSTVEQSPPPPPPVEQSPPPPPPVYQATPPPPPPLMFSPPPPPPKQSSPPPPVNTEPPPSSPPPQQPSGEFNDPAKCETALVTIDNCVSDLITYFFSNNKSIGQTCCNRIKQLSEPCFGRAFMEETSYYDKVIKLCS